MQHFSYLLGLFDYKQKLFSAAVREEEVWMVGKGTGTESKLELPPELKQRLKCKYNLRFGKTHLVLTQMCVCVIFQMHLENFYSCLGLLAEENVKKMRQKLLQNMHVCQTTAKTEHTEPGKRVQT